MKIKIKLLISLLLLLFCSVNLLAERRHIILFISDGTQLEHFIAGSRYLTGTDDGLIFQKFPYSGYVTTWDVTCYNAYATIKGVPFYDPEKFDPVIGYDPSLGGAKPYPLEFKDTQLDYFIKGGMIMNFTDSASAATALATGRKTVNGSICWLPGGQPDGKLVNISEILKEKLGFATGIVSTVPFSHATPAGFSSHNTSRNNYIQIASEIINSVKPDVVIGGGHPAGLTDESHSGFEYISEEDYNNLKKSTDYIFAERGKNINGAEQLLKASEKAAEKNKKLFGLYGGEVVAKYRYRGGGFDHPEPLDQPGNPVIKFNPENPTLADAVKAAFNVLKKDNEGFFVMFEQGDVDWANHFHDYNWMIGTMYDLDHAVRTAVEMIDMPGDKIDWSNTTIIVTADHSNSYMRLNGKNILGKGDLPDAAVFSDYVTYGNTINHTNEPVMIYSTGSGSDVFKKYEAKYYPGTRLIDNIDIFNTIKEIAGIK